MLRKSKELKIVITKPARFCPRLETLLLFIVSVENDFEEKSMDAHKDHKKDDPLIEAAIASLEASMPAVIARREIPKYVGGTL